MAQTNILLESGTNEVEIVKFKIGKETFGINVAKIREIIKPVKPQKIPHQHHSMKGLFEYREKVIPFIDLAEAIELESHETEFERKRVIIANFNQNYFGFLVDTVDKIYRISWKDIEKPPAEITMYGLDKNIVTGVIKLNDELVMMLDYEYIIADINPNAGFTHESVEKAKEITKLLHLEQVSLLVVEDSKMLQQLMVNVLNKAGFQHIKVCSNGLEGLQALEDAREDFEKGKMPYHIVITDIEMPQMDGHSLTREIKHDDIFRKLPVIIFSSLIDEMMHRKGEAVGADAQVTKPEIHKLVDLISGFLNLKE